MPATELGCDDTGGTGADEGAESHERSDELLSDGLDIPADGGRRVLIAVDLFVDQISGAQLFSNMAKEADWFTHLEEGDHGLETTNQAKINTILEGRQDHDTTGHEDLPVVLPTFTARCCHVGQN